MSFVKATLAVVAGGIVSCAAAAQSPGGYLADPRNGCKVWIDSLDYYKSVRWDGACKGGLASGGGRFTLTGEQGAASSGEAEFVDGKRNGRGFETYGSGSRLEGTYRDNKLNGRGWQIMAGEYAGERYDGAFVNGMYEGAGVYTWPDGRRLEAQFKEGLPKGPAKYRDASGRGMNVVMNNFCLYVNGRLAEELVVGGLASACRSQLE